MTLDILKYAKRYHVTVSFLADTGLKEATEKVQKYNLLLRDIPINELLSAGDLEKVGDAVGLIFSHLNKKLRISQYPIKRALQFVEAISKDLNDQLIKILEEKRLMHQSFEDFIQVYQGACATLEIWDENIKEFITVARELTRKRGDKFIRKFFYLKCSHQS